MTLHESAVWGRMKAATRLIENKVGPTPLPIKESITSQSHDKTHLGIQLLHQFRLGKTKEALELLQQNVDVNCKDSAGWSCIHYAANVGHIDLIIQLYEKGANINARDMSRETALHKATRKGHVEVVVALLSFGADITSSNHHGQTVLDLAVNCLHMQIVELLCSLGAEIELQDWKWAMRELNPKQKEIATILLRYHAVAPAYKQKSIVSKIMYVKPGGNVCINELDTEIDTDNFTEAFFLYCSKMKREYSSVKRGLRKEEETVSDIYEYKLWHHKRKVLEFKTRVNDVLKCSENFSIASPQGKIGRVESVKTYLHFSEVTLKINVRKNSVTFYLLKVAMPEKFDITKEAVTLAPLAEPNAEIRIPKATFEREGKLSLQFFNTQDVNEDKVGNVVTTNMIEIYMSNGQQPKQEIEMKIPIHYKMSPEDRVFILATSEEDPCSVDDWEIIDAQMDESRKTATFKIKHFSIYVGSSKEKVKVDCPGVVKAVERSLNKEKKVQFFLISKWVNSETLLVAMEVAMTRKVDGRIKSWIQLGYSADSLKRSNECSCRCGQRFRLSFSGNLREVSGQKDFDLIFESNRDNNRIFNMTTDDIENRQNGIVEIFRENEISTVIPVESKGLFTCYGPTKIQTETSVEYISLESMTYDIMKPTVKHTKVLITRESEVDMLYKRSMSKSVLPAYKGRTK